MRKLILLFIFSGVFAFTSFAQDTLYFLAPVVSGLSVDQQGNISFADSIFNAGPGTFSDTLQFGVKINSNVYGANPSFLSYNPIIAPPDSIRTGDVKMINFTVHDTLPPGGGYEVGPNIIVIWPIYNNQPVNSFDSLRVTAYYYPLGIADAPLAKMFIYQMPGYLHVNFGDAENLVQRVRIINILGQGVYADLPDRSKSIPTAGWSAGIYLCEITTYSGEMRTLKFRLE